MKTVEPSIPASGNLNAELPSELPEELCKALIECPDIRIERILSRGHVAPATGWFDQDWAEWVLVHQGRARLRFADEASPRELAAGDWVHIPAHRRHRVEWTDPDETTIWLAVHFPGSE